SYHYFYLFPSESARGTAAVHSGISPAQDDYLFTNGACVFESHTAKPFDPDVDMRGTFFSSRQIGQIPSPGRAGAYKNRIIVFIQDVPEAVHIMSEMRMDAQIQNVIYLFIQDFLRKPECGNLAPHHSSSRNLLIKKMNFVPQRGKVPGHRQGRGTAPDKGNFFSVGREGPLRH